MTSTSGSESSGEPNAAAETITPNVEGKRVLKSPLAVWRGDTPSTLNFELSTLNAQLSTLKAEL